jgi:hypothetical protein
LKLKVLFWNKKLKLKIFLAGGREIFLMKKIPPRKIFEAAKVNLGIHVRCFYSVYNKRWCSLPCIFCNKFKSLEKNKNE